MPRGAHNRILNFALVKKQGYSTHLHHALHCIVMVIPRPSVTPQETPMERLRQQLGMVYLVGGLKASLTIHNLTLGGPTVMEDSIRASNQNQNVRSDHRAIEGLLHHLPW
ncbi:hypothetical protein V6N11_065263 [Hibiscus sabdariffa]|uniref:Uncharacterized protein n=1 Tax=Hibiscus sabdariffa TaxID=183260 RepID=A0ABR2QH10_9ROSI